MSELLRFACECGKGLKAKEELAGLRARCPACAAVVTIPGAPCPYCRRAIVPAPKRSRKCPHCRARLVVRRGRPLTEDGAAKFDAELTEQYAWKRCADIVHRMGIRKPPETLTEYLDHCTFMPGDRELHERMDFFVASNSDGEETARWENGRFTYKTKVWTEAMVEEFLDGYFATVYHEPGDRERVMELVKRSPYSGMGHDLL